MTENVSCNKGDGTHYIHQFHNEGWSLQTWFITFNPKELYLQHFLIEKHQTKDDTEDLSSNEGDGIH